MPKEQSVCHCSVSSAGEWRGVSGIGKLLTQHWHTGSFRAVESGQPARTRQPHRCSPLLPFILAATLCHTTPFLARADVVSATGRAIDVNATLTHLAAGELRYHTANGQEVSRPVEQIRYLQITGWDSFNAAEKLQRDGKTAAAVVAYERLLEDAAPGGGMDRTLLVQCRLVSLHEQLGRFDKAVAAYLAVIARMPECIETLRPTHIPRNDPTLLEKAAELVDAAIARWEPKDPVHVSLSAWRTTWPGMALNPGQPKPPTQEPALSMPPATTRPAAGRAAELGPPEAGALRSLIEAGKHEEAIERIEFLLKTAGHAARGELYYWQARALAVRSMEQAGDEARTDQRRAGLAFMRVVILFPESPLAAECLYRAGELCAAMDQTGRAAGLWMELITAHPSAGEWVQQARQALARIQTTSAPAR
ncbi:MAG: hypothetical protein AMXMBFR13_25020 [Phycisphaerae bacterium]